MNALAILLAATSLQISVSSDGHTFRKYSLQCNPAAGTLPHRRAACRKLLALRTPFAPTPKNVACTEV